MGHRYIARLCSLDVKVLGRSIDGNQVIDFYSYKFLRKYLNSNTAIPYGSTTMSKFIFLITVIIMQIMSITIVHTFGYVLRDNNSLLSSYFIATKKLMHGNILTQYLPNTSALSPPANDITSIITESQKRSTKQNRGEDSRTKILLPVIPLLDTPIADNLSSIQYVLRLLTKLRPPPQITETSRIIRNKTLTVSPDIYEKNVCTNNRCYTKIINNEQSNRKAFHTSYYVSILSSTDPRRTNAKFLSLTGNQITVSATVRTQNFSTKTNSSHHAIGQITSRGENILTCLIK